MRRIGWVLPLVALGIGCQKSPGIFDQGPEPAQPAPDQPTTADEGQNEQPGYDQGTEQPGFGGAAQPGYGEPGYGMPEYDSPGSDSMPSGQLGQLPQRIQNLRQNAEQMRTDAGFAYTDLVRSIRELASTVQVLPDASSRVLDSVSRINSFADRIEASGAMSDMHARWAKRALTEAVGALESYGQERNLAGLDMRIESLNAQIAAILDDRPFAMSRDPFARVYEQLADTILVVAVPMEQPERGTR